MSVSYSFTPEHAQLVLGANDSNLPYLEMLLSSDLEGGFRAWSAEGS